MNRQHSLKPPILSLDLRHNLIRIHKVTLSLLGNPEYIQLLVNPESRSIIIMQGDRNDHLSHHICYSKLDNGQSFELYSTILLQELKSIGNQCKSNQAYRIYGTYLSEISAARFSMNELMLYAKERSFDE